MAKKKEKQEALKLAVLGDLIADIGMRLPHFPVKAKDIHRLSYMEVGPGGACNVAIMAARFGLAVSALGEVGDDGFGLVVQEGLKREGVNVAHLKVTPDADTPVAGVVVDQAGEPGYLGYPGSLIIREFDKSWSKPINNSSALFSDGWAEYKETPAMILRGFEIARKAEIITFFDPGPGNPELDNGWHQDVIRDCGVVLLNRREAKRITGLDDDEAVVSWMQNREVGLVLLKRGQEGLLAAQGDERVQARGLDVVARDATGAGDAVAGAMIYGVLNKMPLKLLARLANATGAAKVQKIGTGHNMPTLKEIAAVLEANDYKPTDYLPRL